VTRISEISNDPGKYAGNNIKISGKVTDVENVQSPPPVTYTAYMQIMMGQEKSWAATQAQEPLNYEKGNGTYGGWLPNGRF